MIYVKVHEDVVAMADADLIGKELEEGEKCLTVSERFYKGEEKSKEQVIGILKEAGNINLIGKEVIGIALEEGFIKEKDVIVIQGVPHAQIYSV